MTQSQKSVESFGWQWTEQTVFDSLRSFHRRLFKDCGIWVDSLDDKIVADLCSGNGRHIWALSKLAKPKELISVELSVPAVAFQRDFLKCPVEVQIIQGDIGDVKFSADFIYMLGAIQHVKNPKEALQNVIGNLNDNGELVVSFYMVTITTMLLSPIRAITKHLPKKLLWWITPLLTPIFMIRKVGREMGFMNARHTAYDWFGSHEYQRYFKKHEILDLFMQLGIDDTNIINLQKGLYKIRRGRNANVDDKVYAFGAAVMRQQNTD